MTGTPQLELDLEGTAKAAAYASGSGSAQLVFAYTVAAGDADTDGIGIAATKLTLNSTTIKVKDGTLDAVLAHSAVAANAGHKVHAVLPTLFTETVNGAHLGADLLRDAGTAARCRQDGDDFTVTVGGSTAARGGHRAGDRERRQGGDADARPRR